MHFAHYNFVRVHRSFLINLERVSKIEPYTKDSRLAILSSGAQVAVATTGNAGPDASEDKPVGLLHMVVDIEGRQVCQETRYSTTRSEYKRRGALEALALLWRELKHAP